MVKAVIKCWPVCICGVPVCPWWRPGWWWWPVGSWGTTVWPPPCGRSSGLLMQPWSSAGSEPVCSQNDKEEIQVKKNISFKVLGSHYFSTFLLIIVQCIIYRSLPSSKASLALMNKSVISFKRYKDTNSSIIFSLTERSILWKTVVLRYDQTWVKI